MPSPSNRLPCSVSIASVVKSCGTAGLSWYWLDWARPGAARPRAAAGRASRQNRHTGTAVPLAKRQPAAAAEAAASLSTVTMAPCLRPVLADRNETGLLVMRLGCFPSRGFKFKFAAAAPRLPGRSSSTFTATVPSSETWQFGTSIRLTAVPAATARQSRTVFSLTPSPGRFGPTGTVVSAAASHGTPAAAS